MKSGHGKDAHLANADTKPALSVNSGLLPPLPYLDRPTTSLLSILPFQAILNLQSLTFFLRFDSK